MARKGRRDVRFARVPSGPDTCDFCIMLASRGAVYTSAEAAGELNHFHAHCHCVVVPSWGGSAIEGYDPDEYYERWRHPEIYKGLDEVTSKALACLRVAEKRGQVVYEKPLLSFLETEGGKRDLLAHEALVRDGRRFKALELQTKEGVAIRDDGKLRDAFGIETTARLGVAVENSIVSGDATRANAAKVFKDAVGGDARYVRLESGVPTARYSSARRQVEIQADFDADPRTIVHETFHLRDFQQSIPYGQYGWGTTERAWSSMRFADSDGAYLKQRIADDWAAIEAQASAEGKTAEKYLRRRIKDAGLDPDEYDEAGFVSDMIDAASNGAVRFSGSHTYADPDYWKRSGAIQIEFLGDYGGSAVCNHVEYELMRELFPSSCGTMDEIIEAMANG